MVTNSTTVECASTSSSVASEKEAFKVLLEEAESIFDIHVVTTDAHSGITAYMNSKKNIIHNLVSTTPAYHAIQLFICTTGTSQSMLTPSSTL